MLVDSHCHLDGIDLSSYDNQLSKALDYAESVGVKHFLSIATNQENFTKVKRIAESDSRVHCTVGVHPLANDLSIDGLHDFLVAHAQHSKVVGIGETGLDGHYAKDTLDAQLKSFEVHYEAAKSCGLPLIIHTRDAKSATLDLIGREERDRPGVLHCFTEDWDMAKQAIDLGYYISISGIVTFKQAGNVRDVAKKVPADRLLVETDSPYLAPVPHRGKKCQPAYTRNTAEFLADLRGESIEALAENTTNNFYTLFEKAGA
ncbi:TatD family hydrolase [Pleionea sediminis]|uniref:TatD family hydrolase n=1 Tax=Pleionea sediminis TaxID=2569479 RepID=UPI001184D42F|nr:TatD family hydrolase [Pleionea sediminis]